MSNALLLRILPSSWVAITLMLWPCITFSLTAANYMPLAWGNSWTYTLVDNGITSSETQTVMPITTYFGGTKAFEIRSSDGSKSYEVLDSTGYHELGGFTSDGAQFVISPPVTDMPATFDVGQTQSGDVTITYYTVQGMPVLSGSISYSITVNGFEYVTVPAGTFYALKCTMQATGVLTSSTTGQSVSLTGTQTQWLAENVGVVKYTNTTPDGQYTSEELVSYSVNQSTTTTTVSSTTTTTQVTGQLGSINLGIGWNLVGNSSATPIDVATSFGDSTLVSTVWQWINSTGKWAFYAPSLTGKALIDYVTSQGYEPLTTIGAGEGFWVNANRSFTRPLPGQVPVTSISFQYGKTGALKSGWNLISIGNTETPFEFEIDVVWAPPIPGQPFPQEIATLWTWDNALSKWYFYAPSLAAQGGTVLTDYLESKGYLGFTATGKTLGPGIGFWVNRP